MDTASPARAVGPSDRRHPDSSTGPVPEGAIVESLEELGRIVQASDAVYLRYSCGFDADRTSVSKDGESGLTMPGLSVNPLTPESWWTRPLEDWLARQICQYRHLGAEEERFAWILTGTLVGRGPDCEPLLVDVEPLGRIDDGLLREAEKVYEERFDTGNHP